MMPLWVRRRRNKAQNAPLNRGLVGWNAYSARGPLGYREEQEVAEFGAPKASSKSQTHLNLNCSKTHNSLITFRNQQGVSVKRLTLSVMISPNVWI